ncbi:MAG TPA: hypothetical protein VKU03_05995 [Roseiarcus sp.]|nr:hypothetical protein [Roseiarcus sp.]
MIPLRIRPHVVALAAVALGGLAPGAALGAQSGGEQAFDIHSGQTLTFAAKVEGGKVIVGRPRVSRLGAAHPAAGEMTVDLTPRDKDMYEQVIVNEKTSQPIDFVATALVGDVKIDERVLCGRLDGPASSRIGANHWRVRLHDFEVGKGDGSCD